MTLRTYGPDACDELALRIFDLAAVLREISVSCREHGLPGVALHDKKPREWLDSLESWALDAQARVQTEVLRHRGAQRARATARRK